MKTKTINKIVVKDGKSKIASWNQDFEHRPTVGERVKIPAAVAETIKDFKPEATVSLVQMDQTTGDFQIVVDAECKLPTDQRPVVALNASLIPDRIRTDVEGHLRKRLDSPVLDWEESSATTPIIHLHPFKSKLRTPLEKLQAEVGEMVNEAIKLAPC
jgi:hypothetical protein